jgi:hypothetical protein
MGVSSKKKVTPPPKMEAVRSSEKFAPTYKATRRHIPEDSNPRSHHVIISNAI